MSNSKIFEILLVEDNDIDAELTIRALQKNNLSNRIVRMVDGQELIDYMFLPDINSGGENQHDPKLILLDLKLPKISGLEVLKILKNDPRTKTIPVVVLTSSAEDQDISECYRYGVNSYIVKPVEFDEFIEAVQKLGIYWQLVNQLSQTSSGQ
jgi:CheY-like chemotaxis protein